MEKTLYFTDDLKSLNEAYELHHGLLSTDTVKVNAIVSFLESMCGQPKPGDLVDVTVIYPESFRNYPKARIEKIRDGKASICLDPFVPHMDEIGKAEISGGPWKSIPVGQLSYQGKTEAPFWTWGTKGRMSAGGGVHFKAQVSRFTVQVNIEQPKL